MTTLRSIWRPTAVLALSASLAAGSLPNPEGDQLSWYHGPFADALASAKDSGSPVMIYFWKDGSEMCGKLYTESLATESAAKELGDYVCYSAKLQESTGAELFGKYGIRTMPTVLMLDAEGNVEDGILGYIESKGFLDEIKRIKKGVDTVSDFRRRVAEEPKDLELAYQLALKLQDLGDPEGYDQVVAGIREKDPKGKTKTGADVAWRATMKEILKSTGDETDYKTASLEPMYRFLEACDHQEIKFAGWDWLSQMEYAKGNREAMRKAAMKAWKYIPEEKIVDWGSETASKAYNMREELSKKEKKMALKIATRALTQLEKYSADRSQKEGYDMSKLNNYMASVLDTVACCQHMNGKKKEAIATITKSIKLAPDNEKFQKRLKAFKG